ncbi:unnamed protein product, partial [Discosporangium mesarthrocarpum]
MSTSQLVRLASMRTVRRRSPRSLPDHGSHTLPRAGSGSGVSSAGPKWMKTVTGFSMSGQSEGLHGDEVIASAAEVRIEAFACNSAGPTSVLLASLSNSILLMMRIDAGGKILRRWLLEWSVQGKIRGLCISHDLQCVLCVTDQLAVYILPIDDLEGNISGQGVGSSSGTESSAGPSPDTPNAKANNVDSNAKSNTNSSGSGGGKGGAINGRCPGAARAGGTGSGARGSQPQRVGKVMTSTSLLRLASRGHRKQPRGGARATG